MKKVSLLVLVLPLLALAQDIRHETTTINIEIPVRVFKGNAFVDGLTLDDFEVYDNGQAQKLEAVYLVKKATIERRSETKIFTPQTARHFYLLFEIAEFDPRLREAVDFFVKNVLVPGDDLVIGTPVKTYRMKGDILLTAGKEEISRRVTGLVRHDALIGYSEYRAILDEMKPLAQRIASVLEGTSSSDSDFHADPFLNNIVPTTGLSVEGLLQDYSQLLDRLQSLRVIDAGRLLEFARYLKAQEGQKTVFLFYQREFLPKLDPKILAMSGAKYNDNLDILQTLNGLFQSYRRDAPFNMEDVNKAFSDSSTAVHFLYIAKPAEKIGGLVMAEQSEDIFSTFSEMAEATGGLAASSANISALMNEVAEASENYYLLYYTPAGHRADGTFHALRVKVKGGGVRVIHRSGYIAD